LRCWSGRDHSLDFVITTAINIFTFFSLNAPCPLWLKFGSGALPRILLKHAWSHRWSFRSKPLSCSSNLAFHFQPKVHFLPFTFVRAQKFCCTSQSRDGIATTSVLQLNFVQASSLVWKAWSSGPACLILWLYRLENDNTAPNRSSIMTIIDSPKVESGGSVQGVRPAVIEVWLFWWGFVDLMMPRSCWVDREHNLQFLKSCIKHMWTIPGSTNNLEWLDGCNSIHSLNCQTIFRFSSTLLESLKMVSIAYCAVIWLPLPPRNRVQKNLQYEKPDPRYFMVCSHLPNWPSQILVVVPSNWL
jgi:hypothetical protein